LNSTELGKLPKNLMSLQLECQIDNIGIQNLFKSSCGGNLKKETLFATLQENHRQWIQESSR